MADGLSALCVECGLCCDGSLFRFLPLSAADVDRCRELGLQVVRQSDQDAMPLPCPRLEARCCTVYERRPQGCRTYGCRTLHRLHQGELSAQEALAVVREAQRRIAWLRACWPGHEPVVQRATVEALAGRLDGVALRALEEVHAWLDSQVHWPG